MHLRRVPIAINFRYENRPIDHLIRNSPHTTHDNSSSNIPHNMSFLSEKKHPYHAFRASKIPPPNSFLTQLDLVTLLPIRKNVLHYVVSSAKRLLTWYFFCNTCSIRTLFLAKHLQHAVSFYLQRITTRYRLTCIDAK